MLNRLLAAAVLFAVGCGGPPLANTYDSAENLARAVLTAIEERDDATLRAVALDREEFTNHVWPQLPSARPERNLSAGFVWGDLNQKSNLTLQRTLHAHGGRHYELRAIRFLGKRTDYGTYVVYRESELTVKDAGGQEHQIRLFGSVLEQNGRYKVFSYVVND